MQLVKVGNLILNMDTVRMIVPGTEMEYATKRQEVGVWVEFVAEQWVEGNGFTSARFVPNPDGAALLSWCENRAANVAFDDLNR